MNKTNKPKKEFQLVAEATHLMALKEIKQEPLKSGKGEALNARFVVRGSNNPDKDKLVFESFIIKHESEKAVEFGLSKLDAFVKAVNGGEGLAELGGDYTRIGDDLTGVPFNAVVIVEEGNEYVDSTTGETKVGKPRNKIKYYNAR